MPGALTTMHVTYLDLHVVPADTQPFQYIPILPPCLAESTDIPRQEDLFPQLSNKVKLFRGDSFPCLILASYKYTRTVFTQKRLFTSELLLRTSLEDEDPATRNLSFN
jgi:hypothetical protein